VGTRDNSKVVSRRLLVVEDNDISKPLGIITPGDFTDYLKENLNIEDVNAKIIESIKQEQWKIK
jgi:hypothetical protein